MFVALDLMRQIYHYTIIPSSHNLVNFPLQTTLVFIILVESFILFLFAFNHLLPKKVMYFIASPLPVNLQAYIFMAIIYTKFLPNWYMLVAAAIAFLILWIIIVLLRIGEHFLIHRIHISKLNEAKVLRSDARKLKAAAKKLRGAPKEQTLAKVAHDLAKATRIEDAVINAEKFEFGDVEVARQLVHRLSKKSGVYKAIKD